MRGLASIRILTVIVLVAAALVPSWVAPATTITVPLTLARSLAVGHNGGRVGFAFPATHVAFTWRGGSRSGLEFHVQGGTPLRWQRVTEGEALGAEGNAHVSAVLAVEGASALDWRPARTPAGAAEVRGVTIDYLNTTDGPAREVVIPSVADAATDDPTIVTRAEWGADESVKKTSGGCRRVFHPLQQIFVHHTAGTNYDTDPAATMRAIYWFHTQRQGWCDVGYNFVIAHDGTIFEGRWARNYRPWERHTSENTVGEVVTGAHVEGYNSGSVGISMMGNFSQIEVPPAARQSLVEMLAWETDRHDLDPTGVHSYRNPESGATRQLYLISGHKDAGSTACPGRYLYEELPEIREEVAALNGEGRTSSTITLQAEQGRIRYGDSARFSGGLVDSTGAALAGHPVSAYYRKTGGRWKQGPETVTGPAGDFEFLLETNRNMNAIAVFDGDTYTWGSQSFPAAVRVSPLVTIEAEGGTRDAAGVSHHSGTRRVTLSGEVEPRHPGHEVVVKVSRRMDSGRFRSLESRSLVLDNDGSYRFNFRVREDDGGTYRAVTIFGEHDDHAAGRSDPVLFVVDP